MPTYNHLVQYPPYNKFKYGYCLDCKKRVTISSHPKTKRTKLEQFVGDLKMNIKNDEKAVSPVIGVILMVAITVVLAAVVFVLVMGLSNHSSNLPNTISITQQNNNYNLTVITVSPNMDYSKLLIKQNGNLVTFTHTGNSIISAGDSINLTGLTTGKVYNINLIYNDAIVATITVR